MRKIYYLWLIGFVVVFAGCTGQQTKETGILIENVLSSSKMQPGGSVLLRTSISNFFENELQDTIAKLVITYGDLTVVPQGIVKIGTVQANPNATSRTQWTISLSKDAKPGTVYTNKVRVCFKYNQTAWHEIALVNSFDINITPQYASETGPLAITFSGLESSYIQNDQIKSQIPINIGIRNNYKGRIGTINLPRGEIPNITFIKVVIHDNQGGPAEGYDVSNGSPLAGHLKLGTNFEIMKDYTSPQCLPGQDQGCFICDNSVWNEQEQSYICYAKNLSVFGGDQTFLSLRLNVTQLNTEQLIEKIEVTVSFDYCVESDEFNITVFNPGGR